MEGGNMLFDSKIELEILKDHKNGKFILKMKERKRKIKLIYLFYIKY